MKKIYYVTLLSLLFMLFSCSKKDTLNKEYMKVNPEYAHYISGYTSGIISKKHAIKIKLAHKIDSLPSDIYNFKPNIEGSLKLESDNRTIIFTPSQLLKSGELYLGTLKLDKLYPKIEESLKEFKYQFQITPQNFSYEIIGMQPKVNNNLKLNTVSGKIFTADEVTSDELHKLLKAKQEEKDLKISWNSSESNTIHHFIIDNVKRDDKSGNITLSFKGNSIGIDKDETVNYEIPSFSDFKLLNVNVSSGENQIVSILFSDPIKKQDLKGLIAFENENPKIKNFEINRNEVKVYFKKDNVGEKKLVIHKGIKNLNGFGLKKTEEKIIKFQNNKPEIRLIGDGNIIPKYGKLLFPFEVVGLKGVHLKIYKIYEDNVIQFFQNNEYDGDYNLREVGNAIFEKDIQLVSKEGLSFNQFNTYSLDLAGFINPEPGAIYRVQLSMRPHLSNYECINENELTNVETKSIEEDWTDDYSYRYSDYFRPEGYDWDKRNNPCDVSYYTNNRSVTKNIIASNFGIIAKLTDAKELDISITDLIDAKPLENIQVTVYDYQQQVINESFTDGDGFLRLPLKRKPFLVVAEKNGEKGYLKITNRNALNLSQFNVNGIVPKDGIKGYIYGERGVWRPGDDIYLTCVIQNNLYKIPNDYPLTLEFYTPDNRLFDKQTSSEGLNGFYSFNLKTPSDAKTGNWRVEAKAGNFKINKTIKVETIKPNKLKINLDFEDEFLTDDNNEASLHVEWLHGAIASNLKTTVTATMFDGKTKFEKFENHIFDDPTKKFKTDETTVFDAEIDKKGNAKFPISFNKSSLPSGKLKVGLFTKAFEKGGDFSTNYQTKYYSPYSSYVGMNFTYSNKDWEMLNTDKNHIIKIATVDKSGNPISKTNIKVSIYKLKNRWWYSESEDETRYTSSSYSDLVSTDLISTNSKGNGTFKLHVDHDDWGRYFVRVEDQESRHSVGKVLYIDWPDWRSRGSVGEDASILSFKADKEKYKYGETAEITIPSYKNGRALLSIETGNTILQKRWIETDDKQTKIKIKITPEMAPNVYANITLIQPHSQTKNNLPIRMFGVTPIIVEDPQSRIEPIIKSPEELSPNEEYDITISEKYNQEMTYTLAIVDEGLLDITSFKTPDIWRSFNKKEGLGVRTWDLYSNVLGAFNGTFANIFAVGGSDEGLAALNKGKINRFKPVVEFLGPFTLDKGKTKTHHLQLPNYIGRIKVMVVAGTQNNQFGNAEKSIHVKQPLMVSTTLPRVLSPGDSIDFPITLFNNSNLKEASISIESNDLIELSSKNQLVNLTVKGESITNVPLIVKNKIGIGKIKVIATSGKFKSEESIEIPIRIPNPPLVKTEQVVVESKNTYDFNYETFGVLGTQEVLLEASSLPFLNMEERLDYLIQYPHGCVEQTTSSVFPQLYLNQIMDVSNDQKISIESNIKKAIKRLKTFQLSNGGLGYWPNSSIANDWGTNYAGHFLIEASKKGYELPVKLKEKWIIYQTKRANQWNNKAYGGTNSYYSLSDHQLEQAYRLYTLALADKPNLGAMNRLREETNLTTQAAWRLAASYIIIGKKNVAEDLITKHTEELSNYKTYNSRTYGSKERDLAMKLETYALMKKNTLGFTVMNRLANALNSNQWMSTQTTAYSLLAIAQFASTGSSQGLDFDYTINGKRLNYKSSSKGGTTIELPLNKGKITINNKGGNKLFVTLVNKGTPIENQTKNINDNLELTIDYKTLDDKIIDPRNLKQGTDFKAVVKISNPNTIGDYTNLALTQIFPSGWEIINTRINDQITSHKNEATYQDIKDDRVYTYFDLDKGKSKTFIILLNSSYKGSYVLPAVSCETMYSNDIKAVKKGGNVKVF